MVFVTVKHGSNEQTLFNRDCRCISLLHAIREKCCEESQDIIDLSDKDGNIKNLRKYPNMAAKEVLADREDVVLLKVAENEKGKLIFTPLLECEEIVTKAFLDKLAKGSRRESGKPKAGSSKSQQQQQHHHHHHHQSAAAGATPSASSQGKKASSAAVKRR